MCTTVSRSRGTVTQTPVTPIAAVSYAAGSPGVVEPAAIERPSATSLSTSSWRTSISTTRSPTGAHTASNPYAIPHGVPPTSIVAVRTSGGTPREVAGDAASATVGVASDAVPAETVPPGEPVHAASATVAAMPAIRLTRPPGYAGSALISAARNRRVPGDRRSPIMPTGAGSQEPSLSSCTFRPPSSEVMIRRVIPRSVR